MMLSLYSSAAPDVNLKSNQHYLPFRLHEKKKPAHAGFWLRNNIRDEGQSGTSGKCSVFAPPRQTDTRNTCALFSGFMRSPGLLAAQALRRYRSA